MPNTKNIHIYSPPHSYSYYLHSPAVNRSAQISLDTRCRDPRGGIDGWKRVRFSNDSRLPLGRLGRSYVRRRPGWEGIGPCIDGSRWMRRFYRLFDRRWWMMAPAWLWWGGRRRWRRDDGGSCHGPWYASLFLVGCDGIGRFAVIMWWLEMKCTIDYFTRRWRIAQTLYESRWWWCTPSVGMVW